LSIVAEGSAAHNADGRLPLIEHGVHHRLHRLGGAHTHVREHGDADQPKRFGVGSKGTRGDLTALQAAGILLVQADHPPDGLGDADVIHRAHKQHCLQTRNVNAFRENAVVKNNKLLVIILTPSRESVKEHLTVHFLTVNHGTSLGGDIHPRETTILQLLAEISLRNQILNLFGCLGADQNLAHFLLVNGGKHILSIHIGNQLPLGEHFKLLDHNLRGNDETALNQFRSGNVANHLPIDGTIIHPRFGNSDRMLRSSSEEITAVSRRREMLGGREEMALNRVVCLIKINGINVKICLLQALQGVVGSKDQLVLVGTAGPVVNLRRFGCALVMSLTTMNVQYGNVSDKLQKLTGQLLSKQNAGSNHHDGFRSIRLKLTQSIKDSNVSLATTSRNNHLTFGILGEGIQSTLLVGAKLDHRFAFQYSYYTAKNKGTEAPLCQFVNWTT